MTADQYHALSPSPSSARLSSLPSYPIVAPQTADLGRADDASHSPDDVTSHNTTGGQKRRACNECRQQKLRCDLGKASNVLAICSRCTRLGLNCRVDDAFKRTRKRRRSGEMENEILQLRHQLSILKNTPATSAIQPLDGHEGSVSDVRSNSGPRHASLREDEPLPSTLFSTTVPEWTSPGDAEQPTLQGTTTRPHVEELESHGTPRHSAHVLPVSTQPKSLGTVKVSAEDINELFARSVAHYFTFYHPFLPFLDPTKTPQAYHEASPLLFWSIISVAARRMHENPTLLTRLATTVTDLVWKTLQTVPHSKSVVQSLCLLCTWPFPTSSSTSDVTYMWTGMIMQISIQMGLHRPMNAQDFTKFQIRLTDQDIVERITTWAACNIVTQSVSIGSGLSAPVLFDWPLVFGPHTEFTTRLDNAICSHLKIEAFRNRVSQSLASNPADPTGLLPIKERLPLYVLLNKDLENLEGWCGTMSDIIKCYLLSARLHLHAFYLLDDPFSQGYAERIITLYTTATSLTQHVINADRRTKAILHYCPFFVYQSVVCACFVTVKVLKNQYFASLLDVEGDTKLFNSSLTAIQKMSVANNDLPGRLKDVLAFLWTQSNPDVISSDGIDGLQLKFRGRMSASVVYDSLWRWREQFGPNNNSHDKSQNRDQPMSFGQGDPDAMFAMDDAYPAFFDFFSQDDSIQELI